MPTYEYRCDACEREFEVEKRMSDPVEAPCPACDSDQTHRLISHSSFVLKGTGWYVTDYARKNGKSDGAGTHGKPAGDGRKDGTSEPAAAAPANSDATTTPSAPAASPAPAAGSPATSSGSAGTGSAASPSS
jgi:putative FmdB family regulatory protein